MSYVHCPTFSIFQIARIASVTKPIFCPANFQQQEDQSVKLNAVRSVAVVKTSRPDTLINPHPANVDNMAISYQCKQMADGIEFSV